MNINPQLRFGSIATKTQVMLPKVDILFSCRARDTDKLCLKEFLIFLKLLNTSLTRNASKHLDELLLHNYHIFKTKKVSASFLSYILR